MATDYIIFDLDGTLVDSVGIAIAIIDEIMASRGANTKACPLTTRTHISTGGETMIKAVMGEYCTDPVADIALFRELHAQIRTPKDCLFPGIEDGLAELQSAGVKLSICSNKPQHLCEKVISDLGLENFFESIIGYRDGAKKKPSPDLLYLALDAIEAPIANCVFVGDSDLDLLCSHHVGMKFVMVSWGYCGDIARTQKQHGSFDIADSMTDLVALIDNNRRHRAAA